MFRWIGGILGGLLLCAWNAGAGQPNIIVVMADDLGAECLGVYGSAEYQTPRLDQLAAEGMLFKHAHAQPLCTPSRVKIMTGLRNDRNYDVFGALPKGERTFAHMLKEAGYATAVVGKWQLIGRDKHNDGKGQLPGEAGFDEWLLWQVSDKGERYPDPLLVENGGELKTYPGAYGPAVFSDWIDAYLQRDHEQPFFLYFPMCLTHDPFSPTPDSEAWQEKERRTERRTKYFGDMVSYMDKMMGRIADRLKAEGLAENTLFIFTGDNGTGRKIVSTMTDGRKITGAKASTIDYGTHVPMIAWQPGTVLAGGTTERLTSLADYLPTLAEAAGIAEEERPKTDGTSFWKTLQGKADEAPEVLAFRYHPGKGEAPVKRWVRTHHHKLYDDGRFFDTKADPLEEKTLAVDGLAGEERVVHERLAAELAGLGWEDDE